MGVSGFKKLLNYLGVVPRIIYLPNCSEERCVVDLSQLVYKKCKGRRGNGYDMTRSDGKIVSHIYTAFSITLRLLELGLKPCNIFDGKAPAEKKIVLEERKNTKHKAQATYNAIVDKTSNEAKKNYKRCFHMNHHQWDECKKVFSLMGIPFTVAMGEADQQCAAISAYYKISTLTEDSDILVFGGKKIFSNFSVKDGTVTEIDRKDILEHMLLKANEILYAHNMSQLEKIEHENFVDFCVLMGTDYKKNKGTGCKIFGISTEKMFELFILNGMSIELLVDNIKQEYGDIVRIPQNFVKTCEEIKSIYMESEVINPEDVNIYLTKPNESELVKFLCDENEFDRHYVLSKMHILRKYKSEYLNNSNCITQMGYFPINDFEIPSQPQSYIKYVDSLLMSSLGLCTVTC